MIVKASESGIANQIPDTPKNFGNKIKLGIRKTKPRNWKIQCKLPPKTKRFCPLVLK